MALKVCLAGATGWAGSELARSIAEIDVLAHKQRRGVLACGNFALTVVPLQKFAEAAARLIPQWEIIDYAHDDKVDAPSGTARELAFRLSKVRRPEPAVPLAKTVGPIETRGALLAIRKASTLLGVHRGLDSVLEL